VSHAAQLDLSIRQASGLLGVPAPEVSGELKARAAAQKTYETTSTSIEAWDNASEAEREAAVRAIGVGAVWDVTANVVA
jgi:hypothetical protein